jgi:transcriptional regulator GlxA family with amidase domain
VSGSSPAVWPKHDGSCCIQASVIDIIAERVGYADPTHFIRMFRRAHGATPAAWRNTRRLRP